MKSPKEAPRRLGQARAAVALPAPLQGRFVPPEKLLLWAPGEIRGDFGRGVWDARAAEMVMASYLERGNPIPIDIEHNSNRKANPSYDPNKPPEGGGYIGLELVHGPKGPELWLDPIQWSAYGRAQIESGSRRAVSPDWDYEIETGRPVRLRAISLVQNPGTYGIGLMASARRARGGSLDMDYQMLITALEAILETADDPKAGIQALLEKLKMNQAEPAAPVPEPLPPAPGDMMPNEGAADDAMKLGASYPWEECIADQLKAGHSQDSAEKICGAIKAKYGAAVASTVQLALACALRTEAAKASQPASGLSMPALRGEIRQGARAIFAEEAHKADMIRRTAASAGWSDAFCAELFRLDVGSVKRICAAAPTRTAQGATAGAQGAVKLGALPANPSEDAALTEAEKRSIALIDEAAKTGGQRIEEARAAAAKTPTNGAPATFSAFAQMTPRGPRTATK